MAGIANLRPATRPIIVDNVSLRNINLHFPAAPDPWHRSGKSQPCTAAVKLSYSSAVAAANADDVSLSLDYGKLYRRIETAVRDSVKPSSQDGGRLSQAAEATLSNDVRVIAGLIANCGLGLLDETIAGVRRMDHVQAHPESPNRRRASQAGRRLSGVSSSVPKELQSATSPEVLNGMFGECEVLLHLPNAHLRAEGGLSFRTLQTWVYADDSASLENAVESSRQVAIVEQEFRVEGIRCHCILGVNSHERIEKQAVIITLDFRGSGEVAWASTFLNTYQEMVRTIAEVSLSKLQSE
jgi:dihydroneopterin aldolase